MPLCKIFLRTRSHLPASRHQFLDDTKIKISSKNWCFMYARRFYKVAFFIIFMLYFNILSSKGLVHWVEPITRFGPRCADDLRSFFSSDFRINFILFFVYRRGSSTSKTEISTKNSKRSRQCISWDDAALHYFWRSQTARRKSWGRRLEFQTNQWIK